MKPTPKKKDHKITEDGDSPPPVKRAADEFDTAYFIAEATLEEPSALTRPAPAPAPPAPTEVPPLLAPMAALWPGSKPGPGETSQPPTQQIPATPPTVAQPVQAPITAEPRKSLKIKVAFVLLEPVARQVSLCGEFNSWSPEANPMKRKDDGTWEATLTLSPGRYQYKFIVDGQWIPDPLALENVWNQQGTLNSVIVVRA